MGYVIPYATHPIAYALYDHFPVFLSPTMNNEYMGSILRQHG